MDPQTKDRVLADQVALASFINELIEDRYQGNIPANAGEEKALLLKEINEAINTHLVRLLSQADQLALDELLDKNATDDEVNKFFAEKVPKLEVEIASALLNFRAAYLLPIPENQNPAPPTASGPSDVSEIPPPPPPAPVSEN